MSEQKDFWTSNAYQHSASFVPKLAGKVVQWLDLQKDDVVLDIGCGDGILDVEFSRVLADGKGSLYGIDSSASMISTARQLCQDSTNTTFEAIDANKLASYAELQKGTFTKAFSNAAMHWILKPEATRGDFFHAVNAALAPGGTFAFEMGGVGNVSEMRTALITAVSRRIGLDAALAAEPWFFGDETWATEQLEAAGFKVERVEREWRPTTADKGGVEGWLRLFGTRMIEAVPESEREAVVKECVDVLKEVCKLPSGGEMVSYVRLRALARKL